MNKILETMSQLKTCKQFYNLLLWHIFHLKAQISISCSSFMYFQRTSITSWPWRHWKSWNGVWTNWKPFKPIALSATWHPARWHTLLCYAYTWNNRYQPITVMCLHNICYSNTCHYPKANIGKCICNPLFVTEQYCHHRHITCKCFIYSVWLHFTVQCIAYQFSKLLEGPAKQGNFTENI